MTENKSVLKWLDEMKNLLNPSEIMFINGTESQLENLRKLACETGEMIKLNEEKLEHIFDRKHNEPIEEKKNNKLIKIEHESFIKRLFSRLKRFFWKN